MGSLLNTLISTVTGTDPTSLAAEVTGAEQYALLAAEVFALILVIMMVELGLILFELRK
jgi:hypothetical protein